VWGRCAGIIVETEAYLVENDGRNLGIGPEGFEVSRRRRAGECPAAVEHAVHARETRGDPVGRPESWLAVGPAWQVLVTKVTPPVVRADLVHRVRLHEILEQGLGGKLTLVDAPAGWGKTTLVGEWLAKRPRTATAWLSLDPDDADPVRFWSYLIEAIRTIEPTVGDRALLRKRLASGGRGVNAVSS
jgi:hypothetical protein